MARPQSARRWVASRWALRLVLGRYLGEEPGGIALSRGGHGKPALGEDPGQLSFNLSHSAGLALVAVSAGHEVGVDLEQIATRRDFLALAERWLDPASAAAVRAADPEHRATAFYERWVRHEARAKCLGGGLGGPPPRGEVTVSPLEIDRGYTAAIALEGQEALPVRTWTIDRPNRSRR